MLINIYDKVVMFSKKIIYKIAYFKYKTITKKFELKGKEDLGIKFLIYYGDLKSDSHFKLWNQIFQKNNISIISVFRHPLVWFKISPKENIYPVSNINQINILLKRLPNLIAIFYPSTNRENSQFVRYNHYTHIFIGHGDSYKHSSANKLFRLYDQVWVAGQGHIKRFEKAIGDYSSIKFKIIGQPWLIEYVDKIKEFDEREKINIGYFPTWRGYYADTNYSSIDSFKWIKEECENHLNVYSKGNEIKKFNIFNKCKILKQNNYKSEKKDAKKRAKMICKLHPWTEKKDEKYINKIINKSNIFIKLNQSKALSDAMLLNLKVAICDNSASITEALYLGIPIFVYSNKKIGTNKKLYEEIEKFCYKFESKEELSNLLNILFIDKNDFKKEIRKKIFRDLVDIEAMQKNIFVKEINQLSSQP